MNIVLCGMPACGKSSVAVELSVLLGAEVYDTDKKIVEKYGAITEIFDKFGEDAFRNLETSEVEAASRLSGIIISTGGGCILREENVKLLKQSGKIVYLRTGLSTLISRINGDTSRPLLRGGAEEKMKSLYKKRTPVYERNADITVDTDGFTPEEISKKIAESIK